MEEVWEDVPNYEGYYQISNLGRLKSLKRTIIRRDKKPYFQREQLMKPSINHKGYVVCSLSKDFRQKFYQIHRLVALTFIPNPNNFPQVNHKDGNKLNNNVDNLEWITNYDNMQHSIKTGLRDVKSITNKLKEINKKKVKQYDINGNYIKTWNSLKEIQEELHIPNQNISKVCQGKRKTAHNYIFKYDNE